MKLKDAGNVKYKDGNYEEAITLTSQAIDLHPTNKVLYSNRVVKSFTKKIFVFVFFFVTVV